MGRWTLALICVLLFGYLGAPAFAQGTPTPAAAVFFDNDYVSSSKPPTKLPVAEVGSVRVVAMGPISARDGLPVIVHNNGDQVLYDATVQAEVRSRTGQLLAASTSSVIQPHEFWPRRLAITFLTFGSYELNQEKDEIRFWVSGDASAKTTPNDRDLKIVESLAYIDRVVGVVENPRAEAIETITVAVACFDGNSEFTYATRDRIAVHIPPWSNRAFQLDFGERLTCVQYVVMVEA